MLLVCPRQHRQHALRHEQHAVMMQAGKLCMVGTSANGLSHRHSSASSEMLSEMTTSDGLGDDLLMTQHQEHTSKDQDASAEGEAGPAGHAASLQTQESSGSTLLDRCMQVNEQHLDMLRGMASWRADWLFGRACACAGHVRHARASELLCSVQLQSLMRRAGVCCLSMQPTCGQSPAGSISVS